MPKVKFELKNLSVGELSIADIVIDSEVTVEDMIAAGKNMKVFLDAMPVVMQQVRDIMIEAR